MWQGFVFSTLLLALCWGGGHHHLHKKEMHGGRGSCRQEKGIVGVVRFLDGPFVERERERLGIPGVAISVVSHGQVVFERGYGERPGGSVDSNTIFQLASLSKPLGSSAVAMAARARPDALSWSTKLSHCSVDLRLADPYVQQHVTIGDMYSHRSGLPDHAGDDLEDLGFKQDVIFRQLRHLSLSDWRVTYHYTNAGLTGGGVCAAKLFNQTWSDFSKSWLYHPLGMTRTFSQWSEYTSQENFAPPHRFDPDSGTWVPSVRNPDEQSPAGGAASSVHDLALWMIHIRSLALENEQTSPYHESLWPQSRARGLFSRVQLYGYGWNTATAANGFVDNVNHAGAFLLGSSTHIYWSLTDDWSIVVLTNTAPIGFADAIQQAARQIYYTGVVEEGLVERMRLLYANMPEFDLYQNGTRPGSSREWNQAPVSTSVPARLLLDYVGSFSNAYFGNMSIAQSQEGGSLQMSLGPDDRRVVFPLHHYDGDAFSFKTQGENAMGYSGIVFSSDLTSVLVESLNDYSQGTFSRY